MGEWYMAIRYHSNGLRVIDHELIDEVVRTIVERFNPKRIVLFGSQARGDAGPDSDLDLMIEMETNLSFLDRSIAIDRLFPGRRWPFDAVVYTPSEIERDTGRIGTLLSMIEADARTVYEQPRVTA
jgi:predicted nucleotidyltransferase